MSAQIFLNKARGVRVPVEFEIFKHGGGIYLTISNPAEGIHLALIGTAADMIARLRQATGLIEAAAQVNDQGHISRPASRPPTPNLQPPARPGLANLTGDPRHDWPLFVARFHDGPARDVLPAIAELYKKQYQYRPPDIDSILDAGERVLLDFASVEPYLPDILNPDGSFRRGARARVAEALDIKDAGNWRPRIDAVLDFIAQNAEDLLANSNINPNAGSVELLGNSDTNPNDSNASELPWASGE
jgi:hypothetical protein